MKKILLLYFIILPILSFGQKIEYEKINIDSLTNEVVKKIESKKNKTTFWDVNFVSILTSSSIAIFLGLMTFLVSKREIQIQGNKLKYEVKSFHSEKILEKRIETFPLLFKILSLFTKKKFEKEIQKNDLIQLLADINLWHADYALFFSPYTAYAFVQCRESINELLNNEETEKNRTDLKKYIDKLIIGLCADIGIYNAEFGLETKRFETFEEIGKYAIEFEKGKIKYKV